MRRGGPVPRILQCPPGLVQFRGDFDTGDTSQWELETAEDYSLTVVDGGPGHPTAGRFELRDGDTPVDSGERSEVRSEDPFDVVDGDERWYSFSLKFDDGFSNPRRLVHPDAVAQRRRGRRRLRRVTATEPAQWLAGSFPVGNGSATGKCLDA